MNQVVYNTVSGFNLLDNYKVHYSFDKYIFDGSPFPFFNNPHIYSDGESGYSGKIVALLDGSPSITARDFFTGDLGTGTFSGGLTGLPFHVAYSDYVDIANYGDLFSGQFTFLIGAQTTSRQDLGESQKGPVSNSNILFSNLGTKEEIVTTDSLGDTCTGIRIGGWQIGINAANRLYLETYNSFNPNTITYMGETNPSPHNIWGIVYANGIAKVGLYSIAEEAFSFNTFPTNSDSMDTTGLWRIGSGVNVDPNATFSPQLPQNLGCFAGKMDNFVYFNTGLSDRIINDVAKSLYSELYAATPSTFTSGDTVFLFDGEEGLTGSGFVGTIMQCSVTGTVDNTISFVHKEPVRDDIDAGETYCIVDSTGHHPISGTVTGYRCLRSTEALTDVIVSFITTNHSIGTSTSITGCSGVHVSGEIISMEEVDAAIEGGFTGLVTRGVSGLRGDIPPYLRPDAFSYIGEPLKFGRVIEKYNVGSFGSSEQGSLNNLAKLGATRTPLLAGFGGQQFFMSETAPAKSLSFYLNGVGREQGIFETRTSSTSELFSVNGRTFSRTACGTVIALATATDKEVSRFFNNYSITSGSCFVTGLQILETLHFPWFSRTRAHAGDTYLNIFDTGLNTGTVRSRSEVTSTLDYTGTIQHDQGNWVTYTDGGYQKIDGYVLPGGGGYPTCWKSGDLVDITWPVGASTPWSDGISAEIYEIATGLTNDSLFYRFSTSHGVPSTSYDITVENPASPCFTISGDQWVLFNGQKLVSGIDYYDHATSGFVPSGYLTGVTGTYFTFPPPSGTTRSTGSALSFDESPFFPNSNVIFINGVREDVAKGYEEHSSTKDLLTGKQTRKSVGNQLWNGGPPARIFNSP